jgi:prolyl oligopeptidase
VSRDGRIVAYDVRQGGEDETEVRFFDVDARQDLPDRLPRARYFGADLLPDRSGFYYTRYDSAGPRVRYHAMGTPIEADSVIFGDELGPGHIAYAGVSEDGRWLGIVVLEGSAADRSQIWFKDLSTDGPVRPLVTDIDGRFLPILAGDVVYLQTNWQAPNGRVLRVPLADPRQENWSEVIPESEDAVIEAVTAVGGRLFVNRIENVQSRVDIHDADGAHVGTIQFPAIGTVGAINGRWTENEAFFTFTSFHVPGAIYRYDVATGDQTIWFQPDVPIRADSIEVEQVMVPSRDGTAIPMFIVHRKGLERNGENPTLLTGYGGFNLSLTPGFDPRAVITAERGGVFAVANLRGGGEFGEEWHRAGMLDRKQNVFDDFIAAAEYLIEERFTSPDHLAIEGGSNGGLLVGAAMTQRPDLFQAVICEYPLLDMVRYHQFLVARFWVPEYGSSEDPEQFRTLLAYSPYHNVEDGTEYPATLFITGDADTRVAPLHARKMAARVQAAQAGDAPILLLYDTKSGHSGGTPVSKQIEDATNSLLFFLWQTGAVDRGRR